MPVIPRRHAVDIRRPITLPRPEKHALSIDVAQRHPAYSLSPSRLGRIFQAKSEQDASAMNLLDRIIDYVFRSNAKRDSIRKVYAIVAAQRDAPIADAECARIGAFLLLRAWRSPGIGTCSN